MSQYLDEELFSYYLLKSLLRKAKGIFWWILHVFVFGMEQKNKGTERLNCLINPSNLADNVNPISWVWECVCTTLGEQLN